MTLLTSYKSKYTIITQGNQRAGMHQSTDMPPCRYVRPEHISQDQNSNIKTAFSLLAHTMCENFKSMPLEDRRDFIRSILEEQESLEESNDESPTAKCFLTICHVERAMDNLRSAELPDIVSDVVMFASQEGDGMKSKHPIMPFIVSDWIRQGFRTKDTRGMRYSEQVMSFAASIWNVGTSGLYRLLTGPGNKNTGTFDADQMLHNLPLPSTSTLQKRDRHLMKLHGNDRSRVCTFMMDEFRRMNPEHCQTGVNCCAIDKTMINAGFCSVFEECEADLGGITSHEPDLAQRLDLLEDRKEKFCLTGKTEHYISEQLVGMLRSDQQSVHQRKSDMEQAYKKVRNAFVAKHRTGGESPEDVRFTPHQRYLKTVIEGCEQMDVEIPRLIGKLEGMANGDLQAYSC
uniref:Uncharacterized protein n=1 Tax=Guillardia theta TaxID=55529 RepID=A0A7S4JLC7_GUITH|mmetsp:Transcript_17207/g.57006  ORF Transcript_17207/g.57006 Transcript_17207/m.57006 type:complete len:402 (+) Transcript_17207:646-1851(+)